MRKNVNAYDEATMTILHGLTLTVGVAVLPRVQIVYVIFLLQKGPHVNSERV